MHPILFSIGGFDIHVWGLMVSLGAAAGYMTALRFAEGSRFTESILWSYFFYAIPVGLAGARLWEVLFSWQNYAADPLQALMLWQGRYVDPGGCGGRFAAGMGIYAEAEVVSGSFR
jgi:phosphatidylglycerol:prolipoprotein diacylglycerol transferase